MRPADFIQLAIAVVGAAAAVAAWIAAISSRESAHQSAIGQLIAVHTQRLAALAKLHSTLLGFPRSRWTR